MDGEKNCSLKILTTSDIRKQAREWNLAGDVGLLAHLEKFSENLCDKTSETQEHFNKLVGNFEEVAITVNNITNQFLALQNCQFVENRVYDEETPIEEKKDLRVFNSSDQEKLCLMQYKAAVELGVKLLDTHFHEVHLPLNSDSEEDEVSAETSYIWKPKNPYSGKKFPLVIGSNEWWADDYVGLGNFENVIDTEKIVSDSESDLEYTADKGKKTPSVSSIENYKINPAKSAFLESSSEDLFKWNQNSGQDDVSDFISKEDESFLEKSSNISIRKQQENETKNSKISSLNESQALEKVMESANENSFKVNNILTKELEAKLATINKRSMNITPKEQEKNLSLTKNEEKKDITDNLIFDSINDDSDLFSSEIKNLKSSNRDLFIDSENDDNLFNSSNTLFSVSSSLVDNNKTKNVGTFSINKIIQDHCGISKDSETVTSVPKSPLLNNLFEDAEDFSIIFSSETLKEDSTKCQNETKGNKNLDSDSFPFDQSKGTKFFNENNEFENAFATEKSQESKYEDLRKENLISNTSDVKSKPRGIGSTSSFEDILKKDLNDSLNDNKMFERKHSENASDTIFSEDFNNKKNNLLKTEELNSLLSSNFEENSLFEEEKKPSPSTKTLPLVNEDDIFLFLDKPKQKDSLSISSSRSSLFDEVNASKSRLFSVFEKEKHFKLEEDSLFNEDIFNKAENDLFSTKIRTNDQAKTKTSLFKEYDDSDDLFGSIQKKNVSQEGLLFENSNGTPIDQKENNFEKDENKEQEKIFADGQLFNIKNVDEQLPKNVLNDDDLFEACSTDLKSKDIIGDTDPRSKTIPKTNSTMDPVLLNTDEVEDNLFGSLYKTTSDSSFFNKNSNSLFSKESDVVTDDIKPKPPSTLSLKQEELSKNSNIGKLNIPDDLKFKFESMVKQNPLGKISKEINKSEDLDQFVEPSVCLLKCPSKDRVKIPGRRRPQSRRARQEAISKTSLNFSVNIEAENSSLENVSQKENSELTKNYSKLLLPSPVLSNPLSPSTDEEDCFNVPELDTNFENEDHGIFKSNVFPSSTSLEVNDTLLFDSAPVLSPLNLEKNENDSEDKTEDDNFAALFSYVKKKTKKKECSIFYDEADDDSDDNNLFKNQKPPKSLKKDLDSKTTNYAAPPSDQTKSIPNNESEANDIFFNADLDEENYLFEKSFESDTFSSKISGKEVDENIQKTKENKKKGSSTFVDPLGLIFKD